jgi:hypothetical protein
MRTAPLALVLALAACRATPLAHELEVGGEAEARHDESGALAAYGLLVERCAAEPREARRAQAKDDCAQAATRRALLLEAAGRHHDAHAAWMRVPEIAVEKRAIARALARAAALDAGPLANPARAEELAWRTMREFPDEVPAEDALRIAVRLGVARDRGALERRLFDVYPKVAKHDLGDNVLFALAGSLATHDAVAAVDVYDRLAASDKRSSLRDDALFEAARLLRKLGRPTEAIERLRMLLATRRDALITGSYNSEHLDDAQLLVGEILLDDIGDTRAAKEAFRLLADDFKDSRLSDDALVWLAKAELRGAPDAGARARACDTLWELRMRFPDSNQRRRAEALEREAGCPDRRPTVSTQREAPASRDKRP